MSQVSLFLRSFEDGYLHWCPGCDGIHMIYSKAPHPNGSKWTFDGNVDRPTFSPSVNVGLTNGRCHYFVRDGKIEFCGDSTHALAGKTVDLPPLPEHLRGD